VNISIPPDVRARIDAGQQNLEPCYWELDLDPQALPVGWRIIETLDDGAKWKRRDGLAVIASATRESDGKRWLHVSCSRAAVMPSYADLVAVKELFVGPDRTAIQVFVPRSKHVNIHPFCLHLWHCIDGDGLPDFTAGTGSI
jgi:hypothetical protein